MGGFKLGRIFGIPIRVSFSFLLLLAFFILWQGVRGAVLLVVLFLSVLLHELGHALVARFFRVPIAGIDLHFFGGTARMTRLPRTPGQEMAIAAAGPAVSFALALLGLVLFFTIGWGPLAHFAAINVILGAFNLLPALPMDGGRILRAALSRRMGHLRATEVAVKVARVCAVGLGLLSLVLGHLFGVALAVVLWFMASAELRLAQLMSFTQGLGLGPGWPAAPGGPGAGDGEAEVLGRDGQPIGQGGGLFTMEEERRGGVRRIVVRGRDGRILFTAEQPLGW